MNTIVMEINGYRGTINGLHFRIIGATEFGVGLPFLSSINGTPCGLKVELITSKAKGPFASMRSYGASSSFLQNEKIVNVPAILRQDDMTFVVCRTGKNLFDNLTKTETIILPSTIEQVEWSFWNCHRLERIDIEGGSNSCLCSKDGVLFSGDEKVLKAYPNAHGDTYEVPFGTVEIGDHAFTNCRGLHELHLPNTLRKIGVNAFYRCHNPLTIFCDFLERDLKKYEGIVGDGRIDIVWMDKYGKPFTPAQPSQQRASAK